MSINHSIVQALFGNPRQLFKFLGVGVVNTIVGLLTIYAAKWFFLMGDVAANVMGYCVGLVTSFTLNSRWTFSYRGSQINAVWRFGLAMAGAYAINLSTVIFCIDYLKIDSYLSQALGMPAFTIANYVLCKLFVFGTDGVGRGD